MYFTCLQPWPARGLYCVKPAHKNTEKSEGWEEVLDKRSDEEEAE
jgi:hypothetical protein